MGVGIKELDDKKWQVDAGLDEWYRASKVSAPEIQESSAFSRTSDSYKPPKADPGLRLIKKSAICDEAGHRA